LILLGILILMTLKKSYFYATFLVGFTTTLIIVTELILITILHDGTHKLAILFSVLSILLASLMAGVVLVRIEKLGIASLSGFAGYFVSVAL